MSASVLYMSMSLDGYIAVLADHGDPARLVFIGLPSSSAEK